MGRLDLVIFGATGFTGQYTVVEMVRMVKNYPGMTWGVAGRSKEKLEFIMGEVAKSTKTDVSDVKMIVADVEDEHSLLAMCSQTKVLVNCCGPFRFYGEPVVKAAIESKTNYVDVCGEPQFMELMQLKYDELARDAGVFVVCGCGFDSIPSDLGVVFLQDNFGGTVNSVEAYLWGRLPPELYHQVIHDGAIHYGTWESLLYGLWNRKELKEIRQKLYPEPMPELEPKLVRRWVHRMSGAWCVPFPGADAAVVRRTQRARAARGLRPAHFAVYVMLSWPVALLLLLAALLVSLFSLFSFTRTLMLRYPRFFSMWLVSREGPTRAVVEHTYFELSLVARGWAAGRARAAPPDRRVVARVSGMNPGYGATVVSVLQSAITILNERILMPSKGGVMTTGMAFGRTNLINNLMKHGIKFAILDTQSI